MHEFTLPEPEVDNSHEFDMDSKMEYMAGGEPIDPKDPINFHVEFITGAAGTGKTYGLLQKIAAEPRYGVLCATTGIAAINLNAKTINSVLKYFDTNSLRDNYTNGKLMTTIRQLHWAYDNIVIDEASMMPGEQLDTLFMAVRDYNAMKGTKGSFGIILVGDLCQLPPVKAKWIFEAECWSHFEANTTKLTKVWRQSDATFLEAINLIRSGDGEAGTALLKTCGVNFAPSVKHDFDGTTIYAKNAEVDRHNSLRLTDLPGDTFAMASYRWGKNGSEADKIPHKLLLKPGALVMILANEPGDFSYVNGDLGHVTRAPRKGDKGIYVKLQRTDEEVCIPFILRSKEVDTAYDEDKKPIQVDDVPVYSPWIRDEESNEIVAKNPVDAPWNEVYYDPDVEKFIVGAVRYLPLRLGYATTTHKSQGLSLDKVQLDPRANFFGSPGMAYVALSRARTPEGLRIVGPGAVFAARVNIDDKVKEWV